MKPYKTLGHYAAEEYIVKKSRFIGYAKPVKTEKEALDFIAEISKKHWDATHNVYAYSLREGGIKRYSDDGEPQGTAGMPVLNVLTQEEVTDCVVVVTRYFGGILLGGGGLVRAYSHTAKIAVDAGGVITMRLCNIMSVTCDYNFYGRLNSLIPEYGGIVDDTVFEENVKITFRMPTDMVDEFNAKLIDTSLGKFNAEKKGEIFCKM